MLTNLKVGAALLGIALLLIWSAERSGERRGYVRGVSQELAKREAIAAKIVAHTDSVFVHDTTVLRRVIVKYDSVRTSDTVIVPRTTAGGRDTVIVFIPRSVADSTVNACTDVLHSCTLRVKAADSLNLILRAHVNLLESQQPSRFATILNRALYGLAGVGVGYLLPRR